MITKGTATKMRIEAAPAPDPLRAAKRVAPRHREFGGEPIQTDRRDAPEPARALRSGDPTAVRARRRARDDLEAQERNARQPLNAVVRCDGHHGPAKRRRSTQNHDHWLEPLRFRPYATG